MFENKFGANFEHFNSSNSSKVNSDLAKYIYNGNHFLNNQFFCRVIKEDNYLRKLFKENDGETA